MDFSLWPHNSAPPDEVVASARWADGAGWHGVWFADHWMPNTGTEEVASGPVHEAWALLPAVAAVTRNVRIGPLVAPTSVHHPAVLANRAATIDRLSGGRMVVGLGAGWQVNEHRAYGIELAAPGPRVSRFEEAIQVIGSLLANERTTFDGDFYQLVDAPCDPKPVQDPLPILVGTSGPRMMRIAARHAHEWNTWGTPDAAVAKRAAFVEACEDVGRDPADMRTSVQALVAFADDPAAAELSDRGIVGAPDQLVEALATYEAAGFEEFILPDWSMGDSAALRRERLVRFDEQVVAHL